MVDNSKSIMEIVEKHLSPTPQYVEGRKRFGAGELVCDGETERVMGEVKGGVCAAINDAGSVHSEPREYAGGLKRHAIYKRKATRGKK